MKKNAFTRSMAAAAAAAAAASLQSCPTLCDPTDSSPLGFSVPGILQARILEWVAISFSHAWKWKVKVTSLSRVWLLATPWTAAYQAPPSMGFSRQEYWSGCHCLLWNVFSNVFKDVCIFEKYVAWYMGILIYITDIVLHSPPVFVCWGISVC